MSTDFAGRGGVGQSRQVHSGFGGGFGSRLFESGFGGFPGFVDGDPFGSSKWVI